MSDNEWISTKERLPELSKGNHSDDVLILLKNGGYAVACYVSDDYEWWMNSDESTDYYMKDVIYWQPLPNIPEELRNKE